MVKFVRVRANLKQDVVLWVLGGMDFAIIGSLSDMKKVIERTC